MEVIKSNSNKIFSKRLNLLAVAIGTSALMFMSIHNPLYAGPQSLLDPYASVQPNTLQNDSLGNRTSNKKPRSSNKPAKVSQSNSSSSLGSTASSASPNSGFLSGMKEIGHGFSTSFKATGSGIINGTKSAGAKIASLGGKIKDGMSAAGHKITGGTKTLVAKAPGANKKQNKSIAANTNAFSPPPTHTRSANKQDLPGRPLGSLIDPPPARTAKTKNVGPKKNKNVVARTFDKINIFAKHKNTAAHNVATANSQASLVR